MTAGPQAVGHTGWQGTLGGTAIGGRTPGNSLFILGARSCSDCRLGSVQRPEAHCATSAWRSRKTSTGPARPYGRTAKTHPAAPCQPVCSCPRTVAHRQCRAPSGGGGGTFAVS